MKIWMLLCGALVFGCGGDEPATAGSEDAASGPPTFVSDAGPGDTASSSDADTNKRGPVDTTPAPDTSPPLPDTTEAPADTKPPPCVPDCTEKSCGSDGCEGSCGSCPAEEVCSEVGQCEPDPTAGCAGLELAEEWAGSFDGEFEGSVIGIVPFSGSTDGDLSFSLTCFNSKFIINGSMAGVASDTNPFELTLTGTFNPETGALNGLIAQGQVTLIFLGLEIGFEGEMPGMLQPDGTFAGTFEVQATTAVMFGQTLDPATYNATVEGTWEASPAP